MTDDLNPKALDAVARDMSERYGTTWGIARGEAERYVAAYFAALPVPDRGEMVERYRVEYARRMLDGLPTECVADCEGMANACGACVANQQRGLLDAVLGPATDQEREGTKVVCSECGGPIVPGYHCKTSDGGRPVPAPPATDQAREGT